MHRALIAILLLGGLLFAGFGLDRTIAWHLMLAFGASFVGYAWLISQDRTQAQHFSFFLSLGIFVRLALVFSFPTLSDDLYRFIWDGQLIRSGINPFAELPAFYLEAENQVEGLSQQLFDLLNSPGYYTIYPPVAQGTFSLAVWISPNSWYGASIVMKLILLAFELGTAWLILRILTHYKLPRTRLFLYWLNPLIIIEIVGNIHFEGAMIFFLLLALWCMLKTRWWAAGGAMALSVASKLLPLLLLPFLVKRLWPSSWRLARRRESFSHFNAARITSALAFALSFALVLVLSFLPLVFAGFFENFGQSFDLYFRRFEFNASLYYLARSYGYWAYESNQVAFFGPLLARIGALGILLFALLERGLRFPQWHNTKSWKALPNAWMWAFVIYLLCATTVHPWYLAVPIVLCVFTTWRFPIIWSALICLTYATYLTTPYKEQLWLVVVEYTGLLLFMVYEGIKMRRRIAFLEKQADHEGDQRSYPG
ncbi:MAG: polyprenol phosphomannose-dependent alpha 1,6 mannosyltransferase MptB [Bacteroidota bacterium]